KPANPAKPAKPPAPAPDTVSAFAAGWIALRAGDYLEARDDFDRATDPSVIEDATFWAAVAAARAHHTDEAAGRYRAFLERFPDSPHATAARSYITRLP